LFYQDLGFSHTLQVLEERRHLPLPLLELGALALRQLGALGCEPGLAVLREREPLQVPPAVAAQPVRPAFAQTTQWLDGGAGVRLDASRAAPLCWCVLRQLFFRSRVWTSHVSMHEGAACTARDGWAAGGTR